MTKSPKIGILITARLKSTRLRRKVLRPMLGKPMILHLIESLQRTKFSSNIVLITSNLSSDDELESLAVGNGIEIYRGHPDDVLLRIYEAASFHSFDHVVNCTADNPLIFPEWVDNLMDYHIKSNNDYSTVMGLPWGTFSWALAISAVKKAIEIKQEIDTEVWGGYFTENSIFKCGDLPIDPKGYSAVRLTVDEIEDFVLVQEVLNYYQSNGLYNSFSNFIDLYKYDPELFRVNRQVKQKKGKPVKFKS